MKFCHIFSVCAFLLISLHFVDAFATCPFGKTDVIIKGDEKGETNCSKSCAVYSCYSCVGIVNNVTIEFHNAGCTEDFFHDCAVFDTSIKFINVTSPHEMNYFIGNVTYVSGCGNEENYAHHCIMKKSANFLEEIAEKQMVGRLKNGEIIYFST
uniref:Sodefrin-like factor n=1 Tax=Panagrolaimus sp. PS1159 TaxID=55785 RepID=A0AC35GJP1_9BILA